MTRSHNIFALILSICLSACGGSSGDDSTLSADSTVDFTGYEGYWVMKDLSVSASSSALSTTSAIAVVDIVESIYVTDSSVTVHSETPACQVDQTFYLNSDGTPISMTPSVSCYPSNCSLNYTAIIDGVAQSTSVSCSEFPLKAETQISVLSASEVKFTTLVDSSTVDYTYQRLSDVDPSGYCGSNMSVRTTNGSDFDARDSEYDCVEPDMTTSTFSLYDDYTGILYGTGYAYLAFWWEDSYACMIHFYLPEVGVYYYANDFTTDGSGNITGLTFYSNMSGGFSAQSLSCTIDLTPDL